LHTWPQKKRRNCGRAESKTGWQETKKIEIKLAAICNKNEQQEDGRQEHCWIVERMDEGDWEDLWIHC
jgi:hypothetical protein